jgi:glycosyltransferase involved in cell wall biosynthesis
MRFSLVVVTTDRLLLAERLFASLVTQTRRDFEVIFVHGKSCAAEAETLVSRYAAKLDMRTLASTDSCLSRSRNLALPLARGEIVAFPDDDCVYETDTLERAAALFQAMPHLHVLVGRWTGFDSPWPEQGEDMQELGWRDAFSRAGTIVQFYRREAVRLVGDFDVELGPGSGLTYACGEDTDYLLRAMQAGLAVGRAPAVKVRHPEVDLRDPAIRGLVRAYAQGRMRLLRKHRLPLWFALANIAFPLLRIPWECARQCVAIARYRWAMFSGRLAAWLWNG